MTQIETLLLMPRGSIKNTIASETNLKDTIEWIRTVPDLAPIDFEHEPNLTIANDVIREVLSTPFECYRFSSQCEQEKSSNNANGRE